MQRLKLQINRIHNGARAEQRIVAFGHRSVSIQNSIADLVVDLTDFVVALAARRADAIGDMLDVVIAVVIEDVLVCLVKAIGAVGELVLKTVLKAIFVAILEAVFLGKIAPVA